VITRFRYSTVYLIISLCFVAAFPQSKRPMTFEDVVALNRASDARISPDGRRVAFVVASWDRLNDRFNSDIWLAYDTREPAIKLTSHPKRDDHPRWSPDARRIAFLSERAGDATSSSNSSLSSSVGAQVYLLNIQGGEPTQLTFHKTPIQNFEWSPDGRFLAFIAEEPREKSKTKPPIIVDEQYRYSQLWIVEAATQQVRQLTKGSQHITSFNWSINGLQIVYTARATPKLLDNGTTEVFVIPTDLKNAPFDTASARKITHGNGAETEPRFSPDGRWISFLAHADDDVNVGPMKIHIVPATGGEPRVLLKNFNGYITGYSWVFDSQRFIFLAGLGVNARIYTINLFDQVVQAITRDEGVTTSFTSTIDGMNIAFIHENPRLATEVALLSARIMVPVYLTHLNPQIEQFSLGQVETIKWRSNDGTEIEGLLIYPIGYQTGKRYPLVTYLHGGPEGAYVKGFNAGWSAFPQIYSARGYAVLMPNFRGSSNYGAKFAQSNARLVGKIDYEDVMSGIDELIIRGLVDGNKLAVAGWSYGGYLSAWIVSHTDRFKSAAYGAGLSNAVSYWGTADIIHQRERLHGGTPWEARKMFDEQSPLTHLTNVKTPVLIFHGEKDERVPLGQSQETYRTLKRLGVNTQLVIYPDQGHALTVPSYQLDKMEREFAWIEKHLK
jgi:dipeptidyl aminopeptidase/acylaminoacyl peptidase